MAAWHKNVKVDERVADEQARRLKQLFMKFDRWWSVPDGLAFFEVLTSILAASSKDFQKRLAAGLRHDVEDMLTRAKTMLETLRSDQRWTASTLKEWDVPNAGIIANVNPMRPLAQLQKAYEQQLVVVVEHFESDLVRSGLTFKPKEFNPDVPDLTSYGGIIDTLVRHVGMDVPDVAFLRAWKKARGGLPVSEQKHYRSVYEALEAFQKKNGLPVGVPYGKTAATRR